MSNNNDEKITNIQVDVAELKIEFSSFLKNQFPELKETIEETKETVNKILIREAERRGEIKGFKRTMIILAAVISLITGAISAAAVVSTYVR